jgi:hypothetical protein
VEANRYKNLSPFVSLVVKMAPLLYSRNLDHLQRMTLINSKSRSITLGTGRETIGHGEHYRHVQLKYLEVTVLRRGVGEVLVVAGRAPAC